MTNNKDLVPFSINLPREIRTKLKVEAAKREITMANLLRRIVEEFLAQDSEK